MRQKLSKSIAQILYATLVTFCVVNMLSGCTAAVNIKPACRHDAVYCALVASEQYPAVRVVTGTRQILQYDKHTKTPYLVVQHAYAQAFIDDTWEYLIFEAGRVKIAPAQYMHRFTPRSIYSVQGFQEKVFNASRLETAQREP